MPLLDIEDLSVDFPTQGGVLHAVDGVSLALDEGEVQLFQHLDKSTTQRVDRRVGDVSIGDYDALVLPRGVANPDALRGDETVWQDGPLTTAVKAGGIAYLDEIVEASRPFAIKHNVSFGDL